MKYFLTAIILTTVAFTCSTSLANSSSNDFSRSDNDDKPLTTDSLRRSLEIKGTIYVLSADGEILKHKGHEYRTWTFGRKGDLISNWSVHSNKFKPIALKHKWVIGDKGRLHVQIKQFASMKKLEKKGDPSYGKLLREEKFVLTDFAPISWVVHQNKKQKVIVRLTPNIKENSDPEQIGELPISAKGAMVSDNKGFVWAPSVTFNDKYVALKTHRGMIYMSYKPFPGSKEFGFAKNNRMKLNIGEKHKLTFLSASPFLPMGIKAKVYGKVDFGKKTHGPTSLHIQSTSDQNDFLTKFQ